MSRRYVNDTQAAVPKTYPAFDEETDIVRPAVRDHITHAFQRAPFKRAPRAIR
jgi:hypothetical protein